MIRVLKIKKCSLTYWKKGMLSYLQLFVFLVKIRKNRYKNAPDVEAFL